MEILETIFLVLAYVAAVGFLISGLDDLIFDSQFLFYLWRERKKPHVSLQELRLAQEQWIALLVPAWQEGGVVNKMAEYAARVVMYEKYDIFIGVYPNDPETNRCVDEICAVNPHIHKVAVPHPGPTSKADCLNWIFRAMRLNEVPGVREYSVVALHDAEDVLHPLTLKLYNYFVPRQYDMAQLPVFALELPALNYWVGNTYVDDFAELHTKDLFIRESIGGLVPSAGVGTAFTRNTLEHLAAKDHGDPFFLGNLTEDYEIGIRVKRAGYRSGIVSYPVDRIIRRKRRDGTLEPPEVVTEVVAIREPFPTEFKAAVRQRSRWILGISFQTWEQSGWAGGWPMRYTLLRDRRAPLTHFINMVGYIMLAYVLLQWLFRYTPWATTHYWRPAISSDSLLWKLAILDTCLLFYRSAQKFISVTSIYNLRQAVFSIPRLVVGNFINFAATMRAVKTWLSHKLSGKPIAWAKTSHAFPTDLELREYKRTIEDLLVDQGLVTREQILHALNVEKAASAPLALLRLGLLDEQQFTGVWSMYSGLAVRSINPDAVPLDLLRQFPESRLLELAILPVGQKTDSILLALREPPVNGQLDDWRRRFGKNVEVFLARPSNLAFARDRAYPQLALPPSPVTDYEELFCRAARIEAEAFLETLSVAHVSGQSLPDFLVAKGLLSEPEARRIWAKELDCEPVVMKELSLDREVHAKIGAGFWRLHRMLPLGWNIILTVAMPHPRLVQRLTSVLGGKPKFVAELPGNLAVAEKNLNLDHDPDQLLLDGLVTKGWLKREDAPDLKELRGLIADPLPKWLLLQKLVTEEQLHQAFLEQSNLPPAESWKPDEVRRLSAVLPPGFATEFGCYCLQESQGAIRLGLTQIPSSKTLQEIYRRLAGYPLFFEAVSFADAAKLQTLVG